MGAQDDVKANALLRVLWQTYLPNRVIACATTAGAQAAEIVPFLQGRIGNEPMAFVCHDGTCQVPATSAADFALQVQARP